MKSFLTLSSFSLLFSLLCYSHGLFAVLNIGHRGAAGLVAENSLAGIKTALAIGVDVIDLDIALTQDGIIVLNAQAMLDPNLTKTQSGEWLNNELPIIKMNYATLQSYRIGQSRLHKTRKAEFPFQAQTALEEIPTLENIIKLLKTYHANVQLQIDIKTDPALASLSATPEQIVPALIKILRDNHLNKQVQIQSFDWRNLLLIQRLAPEIATSYTSNHAKLDALVNKESWTAGFSQLLDEAKTYPQLVHRLGGKVWSTFYQDLTPELLAEAHKLGLKVTVFTVDDAHTMIHLIQQGVDGIITNRPDILRGLLAARGYHVPPGNQD